MSVTEEIEDLKLRVTELEQLLFGRSPKLFPDEGDEKEGKVRDAKKHKLKDLILAGEGNNTE